MNQPAWVGTMRFTLSVTVVTALLLGIWRHEEARAERKYGRVVAAIFAEDHEALARLLAAGADPDAPTEDGTAPLHEAALRGDLVSIRLLTEHHADVTKRDAFGLTPLHCAVMGDHPEAIRKLLRDGSRVDAIDDWHRTPLYWASMLCQRSSVELLLRHHADPGVAAIDGCLPLDAARVRGHRAVAALLAPKH